MINIKRPLAILSLLVVSSALTSCFGLISSVSDEKNKTDGSGSVLVSFLPSDKNLRSVDHGSARTVTADFGWNVREWTIVLSRADGAIRTVTSTVPSVTVNGLVPGVWNFAVTGRDGADAVLFTGTASDISIVSDATVPVVVPLNLVATGNGTVRLVVSVPDYLDIISATVSIESDIWTVPLVLDNVTQTRRFVVEDSLPPGSHTLSVVLNQPGNGVGVTTPAGYFVEAINVYSGIESNRWIVPDGTNAGNLADVLALDWDDLVSTDTQLSQLQLPIGAVFEDEAGFVSYEPIQTVLIGGLPSVVLTPVEAVAGQTIEYSIGSATWPGMPILSGVATPTITAGTSIWFRVISPNGDASWNSEYCINIDDGYRMRYHSNGSIPADESLFADICITPTYTVRTYVGTGLPVELFGGASGTFKSWNTAPDGTGVRYILPTTITVAAHTELYAQWEKPTVTAALALIAAQLAGAGDTVTLTADFTANDLYAVAALIAASANDITLNMTDAIGITQIPASLFNGCAPLVSVTIPSSITAIGSQAFAGTGMVVDGTEPFDFVSTATNPPSLAADAFGPGPLPPAFKILVPASAEALYESYPDWSGFTIHIDPHP